MRSHKSLVVSTFPICWDRGARFCIFFVFHESRLGGQTLALQELVRFLKLSHIRRNRKTSFIVVVHLSDPARTVSRQSQIVCMLDGIGVFVNILFPSSGQREEPSNMDSYAFFYRRTAEIYVERNCLLCRDLESVHSYLDGIITTDDNR